MRAWLIYATLVCFEMAHRGFWACPYWLLLLQLPQWQAGRVITSKSVLETRVVVGYLLLGKMSLPSESCQTLRRCGVEHLCWDGGTLGSALVSVELVGKDPPSPVGVPQPWCRWKKLSASAGHFTVPTFGSMRRSLARLVSDGGAMF